MSVGDFATGFSNAMSQYIAQERQRQRQAEDADIDYQMKLIESLTRSPNANPHVLGRAISDLSTLHAAKGGQRTRKKGTAGFMGETELPISQFLQSIQDGNRPMQGSTVEPNVYGKVLEPGFEAAAVTPFDARNLPQASTTGLPQAPIADPPAPLRAMKPMVQSGAVGRPALPLPPEQQPVFRDPREMADEEIDLAARKAGGIRSAQKEAELNDMRELFSDEEIRQIQRDKMGVNRPIYAADQTPEYLQDAEGNTVARYVTTDRVTGKQTVNDIPLPPGSKLMARPGTASSAVGSLDVQTVNARIAAKQEQLGRELTAAEKDEILTQFQTEDANRKKPVVNVNTGAEEQRRFTRINTVRDDFKGDAIVKRFNTANEALQFINTLNINTKNPADDQALIYAFAKAMDPDSVVREGEYATVQKYAQSWLSSFGFNAARVLSNTEFLTPQSRQNMKNTIAARVAPMQKQYQNLRANYVDMMKRAGGTEADLPNYTGAFVEAPPAQPKSSINDYRKK